MGDVVACTDDDDDGERGNGMSDFADKEEDNATKGFLKKGAFEDEVGRLEKYVVSPAEEAAAEVVEKASWAALIALTDV